MSAEVYSKRTRLGAALCVAALHLVLAATERSQVDAQQWVLLFLLDFPFSMLYFLAQTAIGPFTFFAGFGTVWVASITYWVVGVMTPRKRTVG